MKLLSTIDLDQLPTEKLKTLQLRQAVRAVVFDAEKNVALLQVKNKGGYYKIPGGGVEAGEDFMAALKRECMEEIGCEVEIEKEIGMIIEYRGKYNIKQESYCYIARLVGAKGIPQFTAEEIADGFETLWVPLKEAIKLASEANTEDYEGQFIMPREVIFLREAEKLFS